MSRANIQEHIWARLNELATNKLNLLKTAIAQNIPTELDEAREPKVVLVPTIGGQGWKASNPYRRKVQYFGLEFKDAAVAFANKGAPQSAAELVADHQALHAPNDAEAIDAIHSSMEKTMQKEDVEQIDEGADRWEYSGTVNGKDYTITIPRGADLSDHLGHKKIQRENPHLEPHEVKAVADTSGEDEEHVEVEHEGKKYIHHVTNNQEPRMIYMDEEVELDEESKNLRFDPEAPLRMSAPIVKMWKKSKTGDKKAAAAWAKHVRRIQKVEPEGMSKKDIEDHMQSHFGESVEITEEEIATLSEAKRNPNVMQQGRTKIVKARVRGGKVQRRKKLSAVKGYTIRGGKLKRMTAQERMRRKRAAKRAKVKRKAKMARALMKRKRSMRRRASLGLKE